jgi:hypothetical protein
MTLRLLRESGRAPAEVLKMAGFGDGAAAITPAGGADR